MRKGLMVCVVLGMVLSLIGCGGAAPKDSSSGRTPSRFQR